MGMRVNLTLLALAHLSMMSRDASWIGFFMYPTLISFSWAAAGAAAPSEMPIASARAAALSSSTRPLTLSRIDMGVLFSREARRESLRARQGRRHETQNVHRSRFKGH